MGVFARLIFHFPFFVKMEENRIDRREKKYEEYRKEEAEMWAIQQDKIEEEIAKETKSKTISS